MPRSSVGTSTGDVCRRFRPPEPCWIADALAELAEIDDEIAEENLPEVSGAMKAEAERILRAVTRRAPAPAVYPTQDAEIALHFKAPDRPGAVLVLLRDDGRADCHAYVDGKKLSWSVACPPRRHEIVAASGGRTDVVLWT